MKWIREEVAPALLDDMIDDVFNIRAFRLGILNGSKAAKEDKATQAIIDGISRGTQVYSRLQDVRLLDLDNGIGVDKKDDAIEMASNWFKYIDKDRSHTITKREFKQCLEEIGLLVGKDDLDLLMRRFRVQTDEDRVHYPEFLLWAEGAMKGKISKSELSKEHKSIQEVRVREKRKTRGARGAKDKHRSNVMNTSVFAARLTRRRSLASSSLRLTGSSQGAGPPLASPTPQAFRSSKACSETLGAGESCKYRGVRSITPF